MPWLVALIGTDCLGVILIVFWELLQGCVCYKESKCEQVQLSEASQKHMSLFTRYVWATGLLRSFNLGNKHESILFIFHCCFLLTFWTDSIDFHHF